MGGARLRRKGPGDGPRPQPVAHASARHARGGGGGCEGGARPPGGVLPGLGRVVDGGRHPRLRPVPAPLARLLADDGGRLRLAPEVLRGPARRRSEDRRRAALHVREPVQGPARGRRQGRQPSRGQHRAPGARAPVGVVRPARRDARNRLQPDSGCDPAQARACRGRPALGARLLNAPVPRRRGGVASTRRSRRSTSPRGSAAARCPASRNATGRSAART